MAKRERLTRSLSKDVFERRMSIGSGLFELFGRDSEQIPGEIVLIKETYQYTLGIFKEKKAHFRFTCVAQRRPYLNSLDRAIGYNAPVSNRKWLHSQFVY